MQTPSAIIQSLAVFDACVLSTVTSVLHGSLNTSCLRQHLDVKMKCANLEEKVGTTEREQMQEHIEGILRKARPNAPSDIQLQIPALARRLEGKLYSAAANIVEYSNRFTLQARLKQLIPHSSSQASKVRSQSKPALPKKRFENLTNNDYGSRFETFGKRQRPIFKSSNDDLQALTKRPMFSPIVTGNETTVDIVGRNGKITFHFSNPCDDVTADETHNEDVDDEESISSGDESVVSVLNSSENEKTVLATFNRILNDAVLGNRDAKEVAKELTRAFTSRPALCQEFQQSISSAIITCMESKLCCVCCVVFMLYLVDVRTQKVVKPEVALEKGVKGQEIEVVEGPREVESPTECAMSVLLALCSDVCPKTVIDDRLLDSILR